MTARNSATSRAAPSGPSQPHGRGAGSLDHPQLFNPDYIYERDERGRRPTCLCGNCAKCRKRTYSRHYGRWKAGNGPAPQATRPGPPPRPAIEWNATSDALLGTAPDRAVARSLGVSTAVVGKRRNKLGIPAFRLHADGRDLWTNSAGYVVRRLRPDDPLFSSMARRGAAVLEHRLVMARHLGRPLERHEVVHHKSGDRADNRIDNLELWDRPHLDGQRRGDRVEDAIRLLSAEGFDVRPTSG